MILGDPSNRLTLLVLPLELLDKVVDETVVKVFTSQMSVTGSSLDLEDTLLNGQDGDIESSTSEIEDKNVLLTLGLLVETVSDGGGGRLVNDSENLKTSNDTSILGGLSLRVVEVSGDSDDSLGNGSTKVSLGGLLHLDEDHGRDLLRGLITSASYLMEGDRIKLTNCLVSPR
jgi:hypothetical protein